ncbi:T9SS type B sorting domain-containing protein [Chitinophaga arvensicola]|uniref:Gliding motility-associated C-terminal domain-containing protein n=1 Tax=Chitinophaga arvensicola TaxID=29529 RepID=A0A1I0S6Z0_9BACT|nr:gliding motility-associated C-terminal domain-containing protein [Chitinophaga arvensicola]SEW49840.1 gliding motility-associated C-terminal domain-containing protein [Chitinophaga arvensicola]
MRKAIVACLITCLFSPLGLKAQKEINRWYFGYNAGINFNTSPASILTDGQTNTREGVATICDGITGDLLFYTEGSLVWNAHHQVMPNGSGLQGDPSSVESGVAVPFPGHPKQYYLFTTAEYKGFRYSIVDMTLDNGDGDIIPDSKNTLLLPTEASTEKMTATRHCNGRDFWIITHAKNSADFYIYLLTPAGLSTPVVYKLGYYVREGGWEGVGYLKFSPQGDILAHTIGPQVQGVPGRGELFRFNNQTGVLTGPYSILDGITPFGVEYSAGGHLLYVTASNQPILAQYDLRAADVNASRIDIARIPSHLSIGGLQMGPDKQIYVAYEDGYEKGYRYVGLIRAPEVRGTGCSYIQDGMDMDPSGNRRTAMSFPSFVNSFFYYPADFTAVAACLRTPASFQLINSTGVTSVLWNFGDGTTSAELAPSHTYTAAKDYIVTVKVTRNCSTDEKAQTISISPPYNQNENVTICDGTSYTLPDGKIVKTAGDYQSNLTATTGCDSIIHTKVVLLPAYHQTTDIQICPGQSYLLPDGSNTTVAGTFTASLKTYQGCDSIIITRLTVNSVIATERYDTICNGQSFILPDGKTTGSSGDYKSKFMSVNGCDSIITTHLQVNDKPVIGLDPTVCLLNSRPTTITAPSGYKRYLWQDGSTKPSYTIRYPGRYRMQVGNDCGITTLVLNAQDCSPDLYVPNAFTPNNDGRNDVFRLATPHGQVLLEFRIFNRWGGALFYTTDVSQGWDGTFKGIPQESGSYTYFIRYLNIDKQEKTLKGFVTLIR